MGCDIHFYVERKENGKWATCDRWKKEDDYLCVEYHSRFYNGRNYNLFSILADVRNGRGFAGIKTGEGFNPISEPRGIPDDCCSEYRQAADQYGIDGHSHSYFTIAQLMSYDWTQVSCLRGVVDAVNFESFDRYKKANGDGPDEYCGSVGGALTKMVSNDEMRALIAGSSESGLGYPEAITAAAPHTYTMVEWTSPYYKCCKQFLGETMPRLWRLGKPDEVRAVFFFDN